MSRILLAALLLSLPALLPAQIRNIFQKEMDAARFDPAEVIDSVYGITRYDKYATSLGGDSVRNCIGYSCQGTIEDLYTDGKPLHKGYYTNGQVSYFKNYYPDGTLERDFRMIDVFRGKLITYFPDGKVKSSGDYKSGAPVKYEEYFENGQLFYIEEYDKKQEYFIQNRTYFENGTIESALILVNPKKLEFEKSEYHPNGNIKEKGKLFYSRSAMDYIKVGTWEVYNESGKLIKEITFENGIPASEKTY